MSDEWYLRYRDKIKGPYSAKKIRKTMNQNPLPYGSELRNGEAGEWISPNSFYKETAQTKTVKKESREIERVRWECPACNRKYEIPAAAASPELCPECDQ